MGMVLLGMGIVGTIGIVIIAIFLLGLLANARNKLPPPMQTLFVLQPGQSRRQMYQQLSAAYASQQSQLPATSQAKNAQMFYRE